MYIFLWLFQFVIPITIAVIASIYERSMPTYLKILILVFFIIERFMSTLKKVPNFPRRGNVYILNCIMIYTYKGMNSTYNNAYPDCIEKIHALYEGIIGERGIKLEFKCDKNMYNNSVDLEQIQKNEENEPV